MTRDRKIAILALFVAAIVCIAQIVDAKRMSTDHRNLAEWTKRIDDRVDSLILHDSVVHHGR